MSLYNSIGELLDRVRVNFTTIATEHTNGAQSGEPGSGANNGTVLGANLPMKLLGCGDLCPDLYLFPFFSAN